MIAAHQWCCQTLLPSTDYFWDNGVNKLCALSICIGHVDARNGRHFVNAISPFTAVYTVLNLATVSPWMHSDSLARCISSAPNSGHVWSKHISQHWWCWALLACFIWVSRLKLLHTVAKSSASCFRQSKSHNQSSLNVLTYWLPSLLQKCTQEVPLSFTR